MQTSRNPPVGTHLCGLIALGVGLMVVGCQSASERYYVFSPLPADMSGREHGRRSEELSDGSFPFRYRRITITNTTNSRVYYVGGQVKQPGRQLYIGQTTITKAIQSAGDFTDFAAKTRVHLTRANGQKVEVNCTKAAKDPNLDPPVYPGDKIDVPQRNLWDSLRW